MRVLRRVQLWAVLWGVGLLAGLSVLGAFLGADRASVFFNSAPLAVFWALLCLLLLAGLLSFRRLRRSPGLLAMHLGCLLVLLGAMYGSDKGHEVAARLLGSKKVPSGYVVIFEGTASNSIVDRSLKQEIGKLPFKLHLKDFLIEYYPSEEKVWPLVALIPQAIAPDGHENEPQEMRIEWALNQEVPIGETGARLRVLKYIESARPTYEKDARPILEIATPDGRKAVLPAQVGQEASVEDPAATVRVVQVYSNLRVFGSGPERKVVDMPGLGDNPGLEVEVEHPDGSNYTQYVMPGKEMHGQVERKLNLHYVFPKSVGAEPDPDTDLPAMELEVSYKGEVLRQWLLARKGARYVGLSLAPLFEAGKANQPHSAQNTPSLYLVKPTAEIRDYKSDLAVLEEGRVVAQKVIEVNHPLQYGGYHFYQHSYDSKGERYTVLSMTSDSGLSLVYAGFLLLCAGAFWQFWGRPALKPLTRRSTDGD